MRTFVALSIALAFGLLIALPAATEEKWQETTSDLWLEAKLVTSYTLNQHLNPFKLDVDVKDGVAHLSGSVDSPVERDLAVEIAKGVEGIRKVEEDILIQPEKAGERKESEFFRTVEDATVTSKVKSKLLWNRQTHGLAIDVSTDQGVVTLKGQVASDAHRSLAVQLAENTTGVRDVKDMLQITGEKQAKAADPAKEKGMNVKVSDAWITAKAKSMLFFSKSADGADIAVSTNQGVVTLRGTVNSQAQEDAVKVLVRDLVGVKEVKSELEVEKG